MAATSNDQGRALEYCFVDSLIKYFLSEGIHYKLTDRAQKDNKRDKIHLSSLSEEQNKDFNMFSLTLINWIKINFLTEKIEEAIIDRFPDSEGVLGNPTDVEIQFISKNSIRKLNLSLKHNHDALKHPRIPRLPQQFGIHDVSITSNHLKNHSKIWDLFVQKALLLKNNSKEFKELKEKNASFIDMNLYRPLNKLVIDFIKNHSKGNNLKTFFKFLVSGTDFYGVKNESDRIVIKYFVGIQMPSSVKITYPHEGKLSTFLATFDNGWKLSFRLHTASSEFIRNGKLNTSTKYDVKCINLDEKIRCEYISKIRT